MDRSGRLLSMADRLYIDQVCMRFEAAWKEAQAPPPLDAYLEGVSEPERSELLGQLLLLDLDYRQRGGEMLGREEYYRLFPQHTQTIDEAFGGAGLSSGASLQDAMNRSFGDYELLEEIGRGGMGIVYKAEQVSLRRRVALKVLPFAAVLDERELRRFKNEAQAAAQLHHTHIVPVFSIGCERGMHYYAMQYIEGHPLTAVIRELRYLAHLGQVDDAGAQSVSAITNSLTSGRWAPAESEKTGSSVISVTRPGDSAEADVRAGLAELSSRTPARGGAFFRSVASLGLQAAEALQHAHEAGIVHRDIKPSNLLLDVRGHLWITDFGLAMVQTDATLTMAGDLVGTIRYMSPEQALARRVPLDHRTDIYSLGVTLYELLGLQPAFPGRDRQELLRQIAFEDPRPLRKVNPRIPRELETIVGKAIAKSPSERYSTAQEMADDLRRFLECKPIQAKPPTVMDRVTKWSRRHRPVVVSAAVLLVLAVVGLSVSTVLIAREQRRTATALTRAQIGFQAADAQQTRAEANYERARAAVEEMTRLAEQKLASTPRMEQVRRALLEESLQFYRGFLQERGTDPAVRYEAARAYRRTGDIRQLLGEQTEAKRAYAEAVALLAALAAEFPQVPDYSAELAASHTKLGLVLRETDGTGPAQESYQKAIEMFEALAAAHPDVDQYQAGLALARRQLGNLFADTGRHHDAEQLYRQNIATCAALAENSPDDPDHRDALASNYNRLAIVLFGSAHPAQVQEVYRQALALGRELVKEYPDQPAFRGTLALTSANWASALMDAGQLKEGEEAHRQALGIWEALAAEFPSVPEYRSRAAASHQMLGDLRQLVPIVGPQEAEASFRRAIVLREELVAAFPEKLPYRVGLATSYRSLGAVLLELQQYQEAEQAYRQSADMWAALAAEFPDERSFQSEHWAAYHIIGDALVEAQRYHHAADAYRQAVGIAEASAAVFPEKSSYRHAQSLSYCYLSSGALMRLQRYDEAVEALRQGVNILEALLVDFPTESSRWRWGLSKSYRHLGDALRKLQRYQEAEQAYRQSVGMWEALVAEFPDEPRHWVKLAETHFELGILLDEAGRAGEAQNQLPEALETYIGGSLEVVRLPLIARRLEQVQIDGSLDEWTDVHAHVTADRERVRDCAQAWTGPDDSSFTTRITYDTDNLYLAIDVNDDRVLSPYGEWFQHDGIEVFWDPRAPGAGLTPFVGPCRQLQIPVPPAGQRMRVRVPGVTYGDSSLDWTRGTYRSPTYLASAIDVAWQPREGGYVVELAIPFDAIGEQFTPSPGVVLPLTLFVYDKDEETQNALASCMVLSGHSWANRYTDTYAVVTFK